MTGRALTVVLGTVLVLSHTTICFANEPPGLSPESDLTLAEQVNDPTAKLTQFQIKNIYTPAEYGTNAQPNTVQIRPIISIEPFWIFPLPQILRPTIRVVTVPKGKRASTITAYDDMQLLDLFIVPWPNAEATSFRWGIGPYFVFPTSSSSFTGHGAWQAGPAGGFAYRTGHGFKLSGLLQQATSFAYTSRKSAPVTSLTFQPIISYQLGGGWYLKSSDATWTLNLRHNSSTTVPLSAGLGKVWKLASGLSIDTSLSGEWMLYRQFADQTEQFSLNFQLTILLPRLRL